MERNPLPSPPISEEGFESDFNAFAHATELSDRVQKASTRDDANFPPTRKQFERKMGNSELSFFLTSREMGVNDMYEAPGLRAHERTMCPSRIRAAWAILRLRHPLISSRVEMKDYDDVRYIYVPPASPDDALLDASDNMDCNSQTKDELIEAFLNGPRLLSDSRLSYLVISRPGHSFSSLPTPPATPTEEVESPTFSDERQDYEVFLCAAHHIGDAMALFQMSKEFFDLLGNDMSARELETTLREEWQARYGEPSVQVSPLPPSVEDRLPPIKGKFQQAAAQVDFFNNQNKQIGGQIFPRKQAKQRRTIVEAVPFDESKTKAIMKKCKLHGVSPSLILFALCNMSWARITADSDSKRIPMMMYSAVNLRPYLRPNPNPSVDSPFYLAVGYFNVILPTFLPKLSADRIFWHRARLAAVQCAQAVKNPLLVPRAHMMATQRARAARSFAKKDDIRLGITMPKEKETEASRQAPPPSAALVGLSLVGSLDGIHQHCKAPYFELTTMKVGTRLRAGGMLMFSYTFGKKLWLNLNWDEHGFERDVVEKFWTGVLAGVEEFLLA
ncbi:hypothetical protein JAAARDRAFT_53497 [Jaapia argillacea MUCL 33604]|uniref:Condensation domain-containing protein n=1 Tax=Jaapia argillacea MUCL 33604 TaxID=933084 RepID=A0A067QIB8_9AGAM|nr:hypothetical protein JAAARDRAFT_53497 [Jaapia argillacea MUCL 33604]